MTWLPSGTLTTIQTVVTRSRMVIINSRNQLKFSVAILTLSYSVIAGIDDTGHLTRYTPSYTHLPKSMLSVPLRSTYTLDRTGIVWLDRNPAHWLVSFKSTWSSKKCCFMIDVNGKMSYTQHCQFKQLWMKFYFYVQLLLWR